MKFKVLSMSVIVVVLVILYVFVGCGRTDTNQVQDGQETEQVQ